MANKNSCYKSRFNALFNQNFKVVKMCSRFKTIFIVLARKSKEGNETPVSVSISKNKVLVRTHSREPLAIKLV